MKLILTLKKTTMKNYIASYQTVQGVVSEAMFKAENKKEARKFAQFHKNELMIFITFNLNSNFLTK